MVAQYIVTRPILDLLMEAKIHPGERVVNRLW